MWRKLERPGYFGRRRDEKVAALDTKYGPGNWRLVWSSPYRDDVEFLDACKVYYELSYVDWFCRYPDKLDFVCSFGECIDNAPTNVLSGCDYTKQEAFSTHIQDIAVRNVLQCFGRRFEGDPSDILVIRSSDSTGYEFGPGNIPFHTPAWITQPSKAPRWANPGSVEDFWQSNKWISVRDYSLDL